MRSSEQMADGSRYAVIPRTLIFLRRGEEYLLMKGGRDKRLWAGKYNGIGGHVERGEDVLAAARRELREEIGLTAVLWLCGTLMVDAVETGVALYVFVGDEPAGRITHSPEGSAEWVNIGALAGMPVVEDVPILIAKIHGMERGQVPFAARSYYDANNILRVEFAQ